MEDGSGNAGRKATLVLLSNVAGAGLGYLSLLLIGRYFAPDSYGAYLFALSVTGLVAVISNLGLGIAHQRHVAQGVEVGQAFGVLARLRITIAIPVLGLGILAYVLWAATHEQPVTDATTTTVLAIALTIQVFSGVRQSLFDTWQGQQRVHLVEGAKMVDTGLVALLLSNVALMVAHLKGRWEVIPGVGRFWADALGLEGPPTLSEGAVLLATAFLLAKGASLLVALAWWARDGVRWGPWDRGLARSYMRFAMPLSLVGGLAVILQYTDILLLGFLWTGHEVGLYGVAQRLASLCLLGALAVGMVLFPRFAQLHAAGDHDGEAATFAKAERYLLLLVVPLAAAMVALPRQGLHIAVGDVYLGAATPLRWLALWALVACMEQPISSRFLGTGHVSVLVRASAFNALSNVALNLLLIPTWGAGLGPTGAALATFLTTLASYAYMRSRARAIHGIAWVGIHQLRILLAGAVAGAFWWSAGRWISASAFDRVWEMAAWGLAGAVVYLAVLALLRELRTNDLAFLRKVTHPGSLLAELRGR